MDLGVVVDRTAKFHTHIRKRVAVAGSITTNLLSSTLCREAEFLMNVYTRVGHSFYAYLSETVAIPYYGLATHYEIIEVTKYEFFAIEL